MSDYPKISVAVDLVLFNIQDDKAYVMLIQRGPDSKAFPNAWAAPGGFLNQDEKLITGAVRELKEETGIEVNDKNLDYPGLIYVGVFDNPNRDPRGRVIGHCYAGWLHHQLQPKGADDAQDAKWFPCEDLPDMEMAFDHRDVVREAYMKLLHTGLPNADSDWPWTKQHDYS